jgi:hypothetical protein
MKNTIESIATLLGLIAIVMVLLGYPVMLLWNWLIPAVFGIPQGHAAYEITFWQAIGLNVLCTILFRPSINIKKQQD